MMKYLLTTAFILASTNAFAQQQQPKFEPYTINEQAHQWLLNNLGEVPAKYANPIIGALAQLEQEAVRLKNQQDAMKISKAAEDAKKSESEKK